ncbi:MAG: hypothetical protein ACE5GW_02315 [Planctomycetota bacterium]
MKRMSNPSPGVGTRRSDPREGDPRLPRSRRLFMALVSIVVLPALPAPTSSDLEAQEVRAVRLDGIAGLIGLRYEFEDESRDSNQGGTLRESEHSFFEDLRLRTSGSIYHRRFVDFHLSGLLTLEQEKVDSNTGSQEIDTDSVDTEYNALVNVLSQHPYSLRFSANQANREIRQSFFRTTELTTRSLSSELFIKYAPMPTHFRVTRTEMDGEGFSTIDERRDIFSVDGRRRTQNTTLELQYEYGDIDIRSTDLAYVQNNASASAQLRWGAHNQHIGSLFGQYRNQSGSVDSSTSSLNTSLRLRHDLDLTSELRGQVYRSTLESFSNRTSSGSYSLSHQLYKSLITTLTAEASTSSFDGGGEKSYGGRAELAYRKVIPRGLIHADYSIRQELHDESSSAPFAHVVDEGHTVTFGQPIFLGRTLVVPSTIVVTNSTGTTIYVQGSDYVVTIVGDFIRIDIPPASAILDGELLLVDYDYQTRPDRRFHRSDQSVQLVLQLYEWFRLYGRHALQDERLLSGEGEQDLQDSRRRRIGVLAATGDYSIDISYEDVDSDFNPFERFQAITTISKTRTISFVDAIWALRGTYFHTHFPDDNDSEDGISGGASLDLRFSRRLSTRASLELRHVNDRIERATGLLAEVGMKYKWYSYEVGLFARQNAERFQLAADSDRLSVFLSVSRSFGRVGR